MPLEEIAFRGSRKCVLSGRERWSGNNSKLKKTWNTWIGRFNHPLDEEGSKVSSVLDAEIHIMGSSPVQDVLRQDTDFMHINENADSHTPNLVLLKMRHYHSLAVRNGSRLHCECC